MATSLRTAIAKLKDENEELAESVGRVADEVGRLGARASGGATTPISGSGIEPLKDRRKRIIGAGGPDGGIQNVFSLPFMDGLGPGPQGGFGEESTSTNSPASRRADYVPGPTGILGEDDKPPGLLNDPRRRPVFLGGSSPTGTLQPDPSTIAANQAAVQTAAGVEAVVAEIRGLRADLRGGAAQNDLQLRALGVG